MGFFVHLLFYQNKVRSNYTISNRKPSPKRKAIGGSNDWQNFLSEMSMMLLNSLSSSMTRGLIDSNAIWKCGFQTYSIVKFHSTSFCWFYFKMCLTLWVLLGFNYRRKYYGYRYLSQTEPWFGSALNRSKEFFVWSSLWLIFKSRIGIKITTLKS